jgi:hypothetical protein
MVKVITLITKFIVIAITALLFSSCNNLYHYNSIQGSGNITTENRIVQGEFNSVDVSNAIDVEIIQSETSSITVIADDNLQSSITTSINNGVLEIACEYSSFKDVKSKKVIVNMPLINSLQASSASSIRNKSILKGEKINVNSSSAANIKLSLEFDRISSESSSGSRIDINGKTLELTSNASSGSSINAGNLLANNVIANVSSGASIEVHPILSLDADASSGGNVKYNNQPKKIQKNESSGGNVSLN